jgi:hypothetical protein
MHRRRQARGLGGGLRWWLAALLVLGVGPAVGGCGDEGGEAQEAQALPLTLSAVAGLSPLLEGGALRVDAAGIDPFFEGARKLELATAKAAVILEQGDGAMEPSAGGGGDVGDGALRFPITRAVVQSLGAGAVEVSVVLFEGARASAPLVTTLTLASELPVRLDEDLDRDGFREDAVVLRGAGFLAPGEGDVKAQLVGQFVAEGQSEGVAVSARLPVTLADPSDRGRALLRLTTDIGGLRPGTFTGTIQLSSTLRGGAQSSSDARSVRLGFGSPTLLGYAPQAPHLGQFVTLQGAGLLGDPARADEATLLRFEGELVLPDGTVQPFGPKEAATRWLSGQQVQLGLDVVAQDSALISSFFRISRGVFRGQVSPVILKGVEDVTGAAQPVEVRLVGPKQVVQVIFLPGFYSSISRFGLGIASEQVTARTLQRMQDIYSDYAVEFVSQPPDDALPSAVTVLEIGGADPNGLGMFGYDNTPGKDVGNVRLFDRIGGANATTQNDGFPGYGGVFIDSILYWSAHPDISGDRPSGTPPPDPLFDEIFDPLRASPATLAEVNGVGDPTRVAQTARAVDALGAVIGETAAHELGHSLGLSQPYGQPEAFHSIAPGEGCLMDGGAFRPFGERAAQPGYPASRFCDDEPDYLQDVLGKP